MKRGLLFGVVLGVVACAPKTQNPEIIGVTFDRLYEEGWRAYAKGDYATAEAKFDSILKYVDATRADVYLAAALSQVPQRKTSAAEANVGLALSLIGNPYRAVENLSPSEVIALAPTTTRTGFRLAEDFLPVGGLSGGSGDFWKFSLSLADLPARREGAALTTRQVPLGFAGELVPFRLLGWNGDTAFLELGFVEGSAYASVTRVNPNDTVRVVYDTVYNVPGEGVVVETLVVLGQVTIQKIATYPDLQDALSGVFLVRDPNSVPTDSISDLHILAYITLAANALVSGANKPASYVYGIAYAKAAGNLIAERGRGFAYEPLPGMRLPQFRGCWADVLQAKAAFQAQLYYNAAVALNKILVPAGQTPLTPSFFLTASEISDLSGKIGEVEAICAQTTGGL